MILEHFVISVKPGDDLAAWTVTELIVAARQHRLWPVVRAGSIRFGAPRTPTLEQQTLLTELQRRTPALVAALEAERQNVHDVESFGRVQAKVRQIRQRGAA